MAGFSPEILRVLAEFADGVESVSVFTDEVDIYRISDVLSDPHYVRAVLED